MFHAHAHVAVELSVLAIMITLLEEYETQRKLLKVRFYPCYLLTNMKQAPSEKLAKPVSIVTTRQFSLH